MKVLICSNTFQNIHHGPAKFIHLILEGIEEGNQVKVLTEDCSKSEELIYKVDLTFAKYFPKIGMVARILDYYFAAKRIKKVYDYDVIIFNHALIGLVTSRLQKDAKVIGMINDSNSLDLKISWDIDLKYQLRHFIFRRFEKMAVKSLNKIIANSNYIKNRIQDEYACPSSKVERLYKAISIKNIQPLIVKRIDKTTTINILFVKSDFEVGGLKFLIKALELLSNNYQFSLTIIGPNWTSKEIILSMLAPNSKIELTLLGPKKQSFIFDFLYEKSDIFCVPSIKEGLGVANMEAMICGVPVVSTNVGGIPEVLDFGVNGWLAKSQSAESIANQLKNCIENDIERERKIKAGYQYVISNFGADKMRSNFWNILEKL